MSTEADHKARVEARLRRERAERGSARAEYEFQEELARWNGIKDSKNPDDFYDFLLERPSGYLAELAQFRLDQIDAAKVQVLPGANGIRRLPSGVNRYAVGDEFEFDNIDRLTRIARRFTVRVTYADDQRAEINGGSTILNQMGGRLKDPGGTKTPVNIEAPADIAVGKRWRTAFANLRPDGVSERNYYDREVVALEDVTVPAGTFKAFKIVGEGLASYQGGQTVLKVDLWIDPATMISIRRDQDFRSSRGQIFDFSSNVMVRMSRVPR